MTTVVPFPPQPEEGPLTYPLDCPRCQHDTAVIRQAGPGYKANCARCGVYIKFVPKAQLGLARRSVSSHPDIKVSVRERILERANGHCELCGRGPEHGIILHVDHMLSVEDARAEGLTFIEANSDENLAALCEECNLGKSKRSFPPRLYVALLRRRLANAAG